MTEPSLPELEAERERLYAQLSAVGGFRCGSVSENYRKCGKRNCACAQPDHFGHGPRTDRVAALSIKPIYIVNNPLGLIRLTSWTIVSGASGPAPCTRAAAPMCHCGARGSVRSSVPSAGRRRSPQ